MMEGERLSIDKYREDLALYLVASCIDSGGFSLFLCVKPTST